MRLNISSRAGDGGEVWYRAEINNLSAICPHFYHLWYGNNAVYLQGGCEDET